MRRKKPLDNGTNIWNDGKEGYETRQQKFLFVLEKEIGQELTINTNWQIDIFRRQTCENAYCLLLASLLFGAA